MPKLKQSQPMAFRLSRDALNIIDDISAEMGDLTRRGAIELVVRFVRGIRETTGTTYSSLLLKDSTPPTEDGGEV